jgi:cell division protein FtsL
MIRLSTIAWMLLVAVSGYAMFQVKYEVMQLEDELTRVNHQIAQSREAIHVLNAEWSYLNQPARLDQLAKRFLTLGPIAAAQVGRIDSLPQRPEVVAAGAVAAPAAEPAKPASAAPAAPAVGLRVASVKLKVVR